MIQDVVLFLKSLKIETFITQIDDGIVIFVGSNDMIVPAILYFWDGQYKHIMYNKINEDYRIIVPNKEE